jgi:hypothetical protein
MSSPSWHCNLPPRVPIVSVVSRDITLTCIPREARKSLSKSVNTGSYATTETFLRQLSQIQVPLVSVVFPLTTPIEQMKSSLNPPPNFPSQDKPFSRASQRRSIPPPIYLSESPASRRQVPVQRAHSGVSLKEDWIELRVVVNEARVGESGTCFDFRDLDLCGRVTYWKSLLIHTRDISLS